MKNVLMIAYAFPPLNFSGTARPLGFAKYLRDFGWHPTVLTRQGTCRFPSDEQLLSSLDGKCDIFRILPGDNDDWAGWIRKNFGFLDIPFQLLRLGSHRVSESIAWRAPNLIPGLQESIHWSRPAFQAALKLAEQKHFDLIWATGDPWSSLMAGYHLSKKLNLPFIADIRDPWTYGVLWNPATPRIAKWNQMWEQKILSHAARTVYTSPLTTKIMQSRTDHALTDRLVTITNGFDSFSGPSMRNVPTDKCLFSFVGNLFSGHKNPKILFEAIELACRNEELAHSLCVKFIGNAYGYEKHIDLPCVQFIPPVTQDQSRQYMRGADILILLQTLTDLGADVISGKTYEYLSAGKPILAVVPEIGGDAWLMNETRAGIVTGTTDPQKIALAIEQYWQLWKQNKLVSPVTPDQIDRFSRSNLTRELAELFDQVLNKQGASCESR
jgi:hypothetical protein